MIESVSSKVDLTNDEQLIECVKTSLASKIIGSNSTELAPLALKAIRSVIDMDKANNVDLNKIKILKKSGGTTDDTCLLSGLVFPDKLPLSGPGVPHRINQPKVAVLQFCISSPKTTIDNNVVVGDYSQIDRILKEERRYVLGIVKKIVQSGANVLLI